MAGAMKGTPKYAIRAQKRAMAASRAQYIGVKASIQTAAARVRAAIASSSAVVPIVPKAPRSAAALRAATDSCQNAFNKAVTRVLVDWLGFRVPETFELDAILPEVNPRLSSFKLTLAAKDLTWLDRELNLRKVKLILGDQEKVVRFKDARDFLKGVNELLANRKLAFVELETWADDFAFLLVRDPRWDKLKNPELVVVKADQTATGGECGECGAPVGKYWSDCLKCGAVFG